MSYLKVSLKGSVGSFDLNADFTMERGVAALFGPSGAGKSLILRAISGLWTPQKGRIELDGDILFDAKTNIPTHKRNIGIVVQQPLLFPHMSVEQNLCYGMTDQSEAISSTVDMLDIVNLLERMPRNLSGGEAQRVAIGRALLAKPRLLLLDEPLTGLDDARRAQVLPYLQRLWQETGVSIIYVSHRRDEVLALAQTVFAVENGSVSGSVSISSFRANATVPALGEL